ncbi:hypothetical protein EZJ43_04695 [Pedobacter changchengzhani]|uniref:NnrS family protein n=1 Tax=Pedobacter changchengzhani TaxID=2529274 RepID=A0A4R5MQC8_9SPHI|nr:hypothetical protein [Pedobacter changchengzhani]TDG37419.1 hypothetical protein EZJ43_04695 [Pedobacter changchengzhani]
MKPVNFNTNAWVKIALINFLLVALAGILLRYKINFSLPFINQKYLLHGHSHFAFVGWVSLSLMALMVNYLIKSDVKINFKKYKWILIANTITAYGMLIAFIIQGYALFSITFSTLSIFVSYTFIYSYWKDLKQVKDTFAVHIWFKTALIIWGISSIGAFSLAYLMAKHITNQDLYFAAIYFFLHFQYNGWFLFVCLGLFFSYLKNTNSLPALIFNKRIYLLLAITVAPSYFLSIMWLKIPVYMYWLAAISGVIQLFMIYYIVKLVREIIAIKISISPLTKFLWSLSGFALILKIVLQSLSVFPYLAQFAFSFRPIVIGYLHLSFLGVISFFILGYINEVLRRSNLSLNKFGVWILVFAVIFQEVILMSQGLEVLNKQAIPYAPKWLFLSAILIGSGLFLIAYKFIKLKKNVDFADKIAN